MNKNKNKYSEINKCKSRKKEVAKVLALLY